MHAGAEDSLLHSAGDHRMRCSVTRNIGSHCVHKAKRRGAPPHIKEKSKPLGPRYIIVPYAVTSH